jgi:chorismate mutase/prephenate dehydratase
VSQITLQGIREKIDLIDEKILNLLKERADLAKNVAKIKEGMASPIYYSPAREAEVLRQKMAKNNSGLPHAVVVKIFREIMSACLALQKRLDVAFLGPKGTFSQIAAETHFGQAVNHLPQDNIERVFSMVSSSQADYGVVPIENSTAGVVNLTLDKLLNTTLHICGEIEIPIHHNLLRQKNDNTPITHIYAHQQTLSQCQGFLNEHYPKAKIIPVESNTAKVSYIKKKEGCAIIAPKLAADIYGLEILSANIEERTDNSTRFLILGKNMPNPSGVDKTSLLIASPHSAGTLSSLLKPFDDHQINMTAITSRPYRHQSWQYIFFIDIEGHQDDKPIKKALSELSKKSGMLMILGSYPKAIT